MPIDRTLALQILVSRFSDGELQTLCFQLGVDDEALPGKTHEDKARELIRYLERRGRLDDLVTAGARLRPDVRWDNALAGRPAAASLPPAGQSTGQAGARVTIRGNALIGKANRINVARSDVSIEENLLAGQDQSIDVQPDETGTKQP